MLTYVSEFLDWATYKSSGYMRKLSLEDRKSIILGPLPHGVRQRLKTSVERRKVNPGISVDRAARTQAATWTNKAYNNACWLLENTTKSQEHARRITVSLSIDRLNRWDMNYGVAALLVNDALTDRQKRGLIYSRWNLSHLCGNWRCLNPAHFTVEPGSTNQARKTCFRLGKCHRNPHKPRCLVNQQLKPTSGSSKAFFR